MSEQVKYYQIFAVRVHEMLGHIIFLTIKIALNKYQNEHAICHRKVF